MDHGLNIAKNIYFIKYTWTMPLTLQKTFIFIKYIWTMALKLQKTLILLNIHGPWP